MKKLRVYLGSPFFNDSQIARIELIEKITTELGFKVYSPRLEFQFKSGTMPSKRDMNKVLHDNQSAIESSDFVIIVTDDKDLGSIYECGYASKSGIPIVYVAFSLGDRPFNLMLAGTGIAIAKDSRDLYDILVIIRNDGLKSKKLKKFTYKGKIE